MKRDAWRRCGRILRYTLFTVNAIPWIIGFSSIIGGFILGLVTNLIQFPLRTSDFWITTPATSFIIYGWFMILVTTFGCFSASSANKWVLICFLILVIVLFLLDILLGISVFINVDSLEIFMAAIQTSINEYNDVNTHKLGFFRTSAKELWDHLQIRGECCGFVNYEDWRNTSMGLNDSIPSTCCNLEYRHRTCGHNIWSRHPPGSARHPLTDVLVTKGCKSLWPSGFLNSLDAAGYFGVLIGACLIFCFLLALVVLALIFLKKYHPDWGILQLQQKRLSRLSLVSVGSHAGGDTKGIKHNKVGPQSDSKAPILDRYLYKSVQINDEEADNYAPELKRRRTEGELYRGRRRSTVQSQSDMEKDLALFVKRNPNPTPTDIAASQQILEEVSVGDLTQHTMKKPRLDSEEL